MLSNSVIGDNKSFEESIKDKNSRMLTLLGKWNDHYRSWTRKKDNLLLIRYEDLILNPKSEINRISVFLKNYMEFKVNNEKLDNIIKTTSFENLKKLEKEETFNEGVLDKKTKNKVNFFYMGSKNRWEELLNKEITQSIEKNFYKEMKEIGYLD